MRIITRGISMLVLVGLLAGCAAYGQFTESVSRRMDPEAHKAYDRSVECQKKRGKACGG